MLMGIKKGPAMQVLLSFMLWGNVIYHFRGKVFYNFTFSKGVIKHSFHRTCLFALNMPKRPIYPTFSKIVTMKICIKKTS